MVACQPPPRRGFIGLLWFGFVREPSLCPRSPEAPAPSWTLLAPWLSQQVPEHFLGQGWGSQMGPSPLCFCLPLPPAVLPSHTLPRGRCQSELHPLLQGWAGRATWATFESGLTGVTHVSSSLDWSPPAQSGAVAALS